MKEYIISKGHAFGNHFVLIDLDKNKNTVTPDVISKLSKPYILGFDQLVTYSKIDENVYSMQIFNSDGSESSACGNVTRVLVSILSSENENKKDITIRTKEGDLRCICNGSEVSVNMGKVNFNEKTIPVTDGYNAVTYLSSLLKGYNVKLIDFASIGNPHCVIVLDEEENVLIKLRNKYGALIEKLRHYFPEKINVEFVKILKEGFSNDNAKFCVWERGVGVTLSCGTGACAVSAVLRRSGLLGKELPHKIYTEGSPIFDNKPIFISQDEEGFTHMKGEVEVVMSNVLINI